MAEYTITQISRSVRSRLQNSQMMCADHDNFSIWLYIEGSGKARQETLEAAESLYAHMVSNVPHTEFLWI